MNKYKSWDGAIRLRMYGKLKRDEKAGKLPNWLKLTGECELCGESHNTMPHAEEYGPEYEDYLKSIHVLCPRCHGVLHLRYRYPNKWKEYKEYITSLKAGERARFDPLRNINQLYQISKKWVFKEVKDEPKDNGEWWEKLSTKKD
jgi:hypothetical protein